MGSKQKTVVKVIEPEQIKSIQSRFTRLSGFRLEKMLQSHNFTQADSIRLLPLLFHINNPVLPGYVDKSTPCGIPNYFPSELDKKIAKTVSRSFELKSRAFLKFEIAGLYLMGSMGTLGQSTRSDLDLWICLTDPPDQNQSEKLLQKTELITQWMAAKGVELNCYLVHQDDFSQQKQKRISKESCGDTQNYLLLDEFYRTAVWLCGRMPLWWLVPPGEYYRESVSQLLKQKKIDPLDWVDFGEVDEIPASEYFSAALWQQYKAIESPYKSSVKLLILEIYARYFPQSGLLSSQYKALVYQGLDNTEQLDPYLMLLKCAEDFVKDQPQRLEFLRRAFYLKSGIKISLDSSHNKSKSRNKWRYQQMLLLVKRWGWSQARLDYLNDRPGWKIGSVLKERKDLIRELTHSYHFLSNFARVQGVNNKSSQKQLVALGRKLYAVFERKSGKIDCVNTGIAKNVTESSVTLFQRKNQLDKNIQQWHLLTGSVAPHLLSIHPPVFSADTLFEVLAWCVCNRVVNRRSHYQIYTENKFFDLKLIQKIVKNLFSFGSNLTTELTDERFQQDAKTEKLGVFLNTQNDLFLAEKEQGIYNVGSQIDFFCWGEERKNLLQQFDIFYLNSWGEYSCKRFQGRFAWVQLLVEHHAILSSEVGLQIFCGDIPQAKTVKARLIALFQQWNKLLKYSLKKQNNSGVKKTLFKEYRYLMSLESGYLVIEFNQGQVNYRFIKQKKRFLYDLSQACELDVEYLLDENLNLSEPLKKAMTKQVREVHHCYLIQHQANRLEVMIREPQGKYFYQSHRGISSDKLISHYQQFIDSLNQRFSFSNQTMDSCHFSILDLSHNSEQLRFISVKPQDRQIAEQYSKVQAIATTNSENKICFDLYVSEQSYCYRDYGDMVYRKMAQYILQQRLGKSHYPLFVTDLDLTSIKQQASLITYLDYKRSIEQKLNHALKQLGAK